MRELWTSLASVGVDVEYTVGASSITGVMCEGALDFAGAGLDIGYIQSRCEQHHYGAVRGSVELR